MNSIHRIISLMILGCLVVAGATGATPADAMQRVLKQYGLDFKILRSPAVLQATSSRQDGLFSFSLEGNPCVEVLLDRDYWVLVSWNAKHENNVMAYALNPIDEQSALNISIGRDIHERSDAMLSNEPGFSGITRGDGVIATQKIQWRRWSDQYHLYSDCTVDLPSGVGRPDYRINVAITANRPARRAALENCAASIKLVSEKSNKTPKPAPTSATPP